MRDPVWANTGTNKIEINKAANVFMNSVYFTDCLRSTSIVRQFLHSSVVKITRHPVCVIGISKKTACGPSGIAIALNNVDGGKCLQ